MSSLFQPGQTTQKKEETTTANPLAMAAYQDILSRAQSLSQTPYQQYQGQGVAGLTPEQLYGIQGINAYSNAASPFYQMASQYMQQGASPVGAVSGDDIGKYMNPYASMVADATMKQMQRYGQIQQTGLKGNAALAGALGGSAQAVQSAALAGENQRNTEKWLADFNAQNYQQALGEANIQQQNEAANRARQAQAGFGMGSLGTGFQTAGLQGAGAQMGAGAVSQANQQAMLDYNRMLFQQQQAYPFQQMNWYSGIALPTGGGMGGSSYGTQTSPTASPFMQAAGVGIAGAGMFMNPTKGADGGRINGYAGGGGVPSSIFDTPGYIPQPQLTARPLQLPHLKFDTVAADPMASITNPMASITKDLRGLPRGGLSNLYDRYVGQDTSLPEVGMGKLYADGGLVDAVHAIRRGLKGYQDGGDIEDYIPFEGALAGPARGSPSGLPVQASDAPNLMLTRERIRRELEDNPRLARRFDANTTAEAFPSEDPEARRFYQALTIDRAVAQRKKLADIVNAPDYYPPETRNAIRTTGMGADQSLFEGANPANFGTGNASYDPKTGRWVGFAGGPQTATYGRGKMTELGGIEGGTLPYARAMGYTGPDRTAIGPGGPQGNSDSLPPEITAGTSRPSPYAAMAYGAEDANLPPAAGLRQEQPGFLSSLRGMLPSVTEEQRQGIINLGLGIAASRRPDVFGAIGEGGQHAMASMAGWRKEQETKRQHNLTAQQAGARLAQQAFQFNERQDLEQKKLDELRKHRNVLENIPKKLYTDPNTGLDVLGIPDPAAPGGYRIIGPQSEAPTTVPAATTKSPSALPPVRIASTDTTIGLNPARPSPGVDSPLDVEEPKVATPIGGLSPDAIKAAAEYYNRTGKIPAIGGTRIQVGLFKNKIMNEAARLDAEAGITGDKRGQMQQDFRSQELAMKRFMSGPQGNTIRGLNVATDHAATLRSMAEAMKNGNIRVFNEIAQEWAKQTGKPAPTNWDAARSILGPEIIKSLGVVGAGTEKERSGMADNFSRAASPDQIAGVIDTVLSPMLGGQLRGMRQQFTTATGRSEDEFNRLLFPETIKFLAPKVATPAATEAPPVPGARKAGDGNWYLPDPNRPGKYLKVQ